MTRMTRRESLLEHIVSRYSITREELLKCDSFEEIEDYHEFLKSTMVVYEPNASVLLTHGAYFMSANSYLEFVDSLILFLLSVKSPNSVVLGYNDPSSNSAWSSKLINPCVSFQVNQLKHHYWRKTYLLLGKKNFSEILLTTRCFTKTKSGKYLQLNGYTGTYKRNKTSTISKSWMLYKKRLIGSGYKGRLFLFDGSAHLLLQDIFPGEINCKNLPKKYRKVKLLLDQMISNDLRCNYRSLYSTMVSKCGPIISNFDRATPILVVVRFLLCVVRKIFPFEVWGSESNRMLIVRRIADFIKSGIRFKDEICDIVHSLKLTDIEWLGKSVNITSQQDFYIRQKLLENFIHWFMSSFICKLVRLFWYVTDSSKMLNHSLAGEGVFYFPHIEWDMLTKNWLEEYIDKHFDKISAPSYPIVLKNERFNIGKLRMAPKHNDFRVLCIPYKYSLSMDDRPREKQKFEFLAHMQQTIRPVREIINLRALEYFQQSESKHPICHSVMDIACYIKHYRESLIAKYGQLPNIYMVNFDMKHCYDRLNQNKVLQCIEKLFENDDDNKPFYIRQYMESDIFSNKPKGVRTVIKESLNIDDFDFDSFEADGLGKSNFLIDRSRTIRLLKSNIILISKSHLFDSCIVTQEHPLCLYKRKLGVFQGFPLLATFCDIAYNMMIKEHFQFLYERENSIMLRLADDFLVISTSKESCQRALDVMMSSSINDYGAYVNVDKTSWVSPNSENELVKFFGLMINRKTLDINKDVDAASCYISLSKQRSFTRAYEYLHWCYRVRLSNYLLSLEFAPPHLIFKNIDCVFGLVLDALRKNFRYILIKEGAFDESKFREFVLNLLHETESRYRSINQINAFGDILEIFKDQLRSKFGSRFPHVVNWFSRFVF